MHFVSWTCEQLDKLLYAARPPKIKDHSAFLREVKLREAKTAALCGDVKPLRQMYPEIADFIHRRPLGRGQKHAKPKPPWKSGDPKWCAMMAAENVKRIGAIWKSAF